MFSRLDKRGQLKKEMSTSNGRGGKTISEQDLGAIWFALYPISTREAMRYRAQQSNANARILMRFRDDVDNQTALVYNGWRYSFEELTDAAADNDYLEILAVGERIND